MKLLNSSLLFSILEHGKAERFVEIARSCGSSGATVFPARGTATSSILSMLGLGDKSKDVVMMFLEDELAHKIWDKVKEEKINGVSALLSCGDTDMDKAWKMITVIVNSGYADDIMNTARGAGATGGTITHARGTASKEHEEHFLGVTIVPEKEMIMILAETDKADAIVKAICNMDCLKEKGMGIVSVQNVSEFVNLGSNL